MGTKVLLVTENPRFRLALGRRLASAGFEVHLAGTAASALQYARGVIVDAVVSDYAMVGQSGAWLLREIDRAQPRAYRLLLGDGDLDAVAELRAEGVIHSFMATPFAAGALLEKLQRHCVPRGDTWPDTVLEPARP